MATFKPDTALKDAPVQFVLCKISCGDLPSFDSLHLANVQEVFRKNNYPHYTQAETNDIELQHGAGLQVRQHRRITHHFISNSYLDGIAVSGGDLFVYTRNYENFETFIEKIINAHSLFAKTAEIDTVVRIGIRYIDLIRPSENLSLEDYLESFILSPKFTQSNGGLKPRTSFSQHSYKTDLNSLIVLRSSAGRDLKIVPDDLFQMIEPMLSKAEENYLLNPINSVTALIDTDHFIKFRSLENANDLNLRGLIDRMHECTSSIFFECVTDKALKEWNS
ncbi:TIGR04255 family protein [Alteromonas stellipolaris]|uniref:TIGR04255 family protein n=1 Tax=Alteromonas stellipolaris TaxID=233316 RepID=UPI002117B13B|nr:TIGR04255 family protein [Alteromonas stellipolaris]MCQ8848098.1 TIGR04255 family protein [Alteromonas stellipolaris]